jgi:hypothetical protein
MPRISTADSLTHEVGAAARPSSYDKRAFELVEELVVERQHETRNGLMEELLQNPHEALVAEFAYMEQLYSGRMVETTREDGSPELQFATRTWVEDDQDQDSGHYKLDDRYSVTTLNSGEILYRIKTMLLPDAGYDVMFTGTDILSVRALNGSYAIPLVPDTYKRVCEDIMARTIATAQVVSERRGNDPQAAALADENAKDLLELELGL